MKNLNQARIKKFSNTLPNPSNPIETKNLNNANQPKKMKISSLINNQPNKKTFFSHNKILSYTSSFFLIFFLLIKLSLIEIFYETLEAVFTFLPMLLILTTATLTYIKTQQTTNKEEKRTIEKYYLYLTLKLISLLLFFYLLYSPSSFLPTLLSLISLIQIFFTLEGFFYFLSQLALLVITVSLAYYFYRVYKQSKNPPNLPLKKGGATEQSQSTPATFSLKKGGATEQSQTTSTKNSPFSKGGQGVLTTLKKQLLYTNFFFFAFLFVLSFVSFPQAYAPLTDTLGNLFFSVSNGTVQVFKDNNDFKRFSSVKDFTSQLATSLVQTKDNLKSDIQTNTQTIEVSLKEAQTNLSQSIQTTTQSLQDELDEDISDKLSISGGTLEGDLTIEEELTIQSSTTAQTILPQQDSTFNLGSQDKGWGSLYVSNLFGSSPLTVGEGSSQYNLSNSNDFIIIGKLEVQSEAYLESLNASSQLTVGSNNELTITSQGIISQGTWQASQINNTYLESIAGSKVTGNISGMASNITGDLPLSQLTNPTENTSLTMEDNRLTFTFNNDTDDKDLFLIQDSTNNDGTGTLLKVATADPSLLNPLEISASGQTALFVDYSAQVGIGTDEPSALLHLFSTTTPQMKIGYDDLTTFSVGINSQGNTAFSTSGANFTFNKKILTSENFEQTCPQGYIWVEGSAKYGTLPGFCVMKYEAKCDDDADGEGDTTAEDGTYKTWHNDTSACTQANNRAIVSSAEGSPIAYISQETARTYCQNLGEDFHLISENEWLTLADQISNLPINDTDNDAGLQLANSHSDNSPATALSATSSADPETSSCDLNQTMEHANNAYSSTCQIQGDGSYSGDNDDQGFYGTGQSWSTSGYSAGGSNKSQNRVHVLKNKNTLWDLSGNVYEWTDALIMQTEQPTDGSEVGAGAAEWIEWNVSQKLQSTVANSRPSLDDWTGSNGIGRLYTYGQDETSAAMRALLRGGNWATGPSAGVWALRLGSSPTYADNSFGFRCAR